MIPLDIWLNDFPWPGLKDAVKRLIADFGDAHPEYDLNVRFVDYWTMPLEVAKAVQNGNPPAAAEYYYTSTQHARDLRTNDGRLLFGSVEEAIAGRTEILGVPVVIDDIVAAARDYYSYDGALFSMPRNTSTTVLVANKPVLDAAGITELPRTWDEFEAVCAAIAALPDRPEQCSTWPVHGWFFQQALAQQNGLLADHDNGRSGRAEKVNLVSDEMLAYVNWWKRLHTQGYYTYTGSEADWAGAFKAFAAGQAAITLCSSHEANTMLDVGKEAGFEVEVGWLPHNGNVPNAGALIGGDSMFLADNLDQATTDGVLAFMQYLINPVNAANLHKVGDWIPITGASVDLLRQEGWFDRNPHLSAATDQLDATIDTPGSRGALLGDFAGIQHAMDRAMIDVLVSDADPVDRFTEATAEAQRLLDVYYETCDRPAATAENCTTVF
jgi:sn-glycerol 3-phosphate transport system substrate-binding protein